MPSQDFTTRVAIQVVNNGKSSKELHFDYRKPSVTSIQPSYGVAAGGTIVTILGDYLEIGRAQSVQLSTGDSSSECIELSLSPNEIRCTTPLHQLADFRNETVDVDILFDGVKFNFERENKEIRFTYIANPSIKGIRRCTPKHFASPNCPGSTTCSKCSGDIGIMQDEIGLFCSGGSHILMKLESYDNITYDSQVVPEIYYQGYPANKCKYLDYNPKETFASETKTEEKGVMRAPTPDIPLLSLHYSCTAPDMTGHLPYCVSRLAEARQQRKTRRRRNAGLSEQLDLMFRLDGFEQKLAKANVFAQPQIKYGPNGTKETVDFSSEALIDIYFSFQSKAARIAFPEGDISLSILDENLELVPDSLPEIERKSECSDEENPGCKGSDSEYVLILKVKMPKNLPKKTIGARIYKMQYEFGSEKVAIMTIENRGMSQTSAVLIVLAIVTVLVLVGVVVWCLWTKKEEYKDKQKGLEKALVTIEEKVQLVARRAYHELNLDIEDLEKEVKLGNLPKMYCLC